MSTKTTRRKRPSAAPNVAVASALPLAAAARTPAPVSAVPPGTGNGGPTVALFSHCTVKHAAGPKNELLQQLDEPAEVVIDATNLERIDTAIMQLLCAFVRERAERNLGVRWHGIPQALRDAARLLGVGTLLELPVEASP